MAKYGSASAFLLVDGYELTGVATSLSEATEAVLEETHALGDSWNESQAIGTRKAELSQEGFYDDASDSVNAALNEQQMVSRLVNYGVSGQAAGAACAGLQGAFASTYSRVVSREGLHKANATYTVNGQKDTGVILQPLMTKTADWNTEGAESVDNGASTANGGVGYLQVTSLSLDGHANLTVKVRHSADDTTYADLLTFPVVTSSPAAVRQAVAGTVNRHLAMSGDFTGVGGSPSAKVFVAFARG
jgi:hypothetical protein